MATRSISDRVSRTQLSRSVWPRSTASASFSTRFLPPSYLRSRIATYRQLLSSKGPVYTVSDMRDPAGRIVHHERLLLPFGMAAREVDHILASLEAASPEGHSRSAT